MFELLEEVSKDLKNYDLEFRIEELESKFSSERFRLPKDLLSSSKVINPL